MLSAIIVDDEKLVRMTLTHKIPWAETGVEIVGEASNGLEAFELCMKKHPDILITDISMPIMDGIELTQKINESLPETQVIFFSGIDDFNYVKTAMDINVKGYILKPIRVQEMILTVKRVAYNISLNKQRLLKEQQLKEKTQENLDLLKRLFLFELVSGYIQDERALKNKLTYLNLDILNTVSNCVALVSILNNCGDSYDETNMQFHSYSAMCLVDEFLQNAEAGIAFSFCENQIAIIFNNDSSSQSYYFELCSEITDNLKKVLNIDVKIGMGRWVDSLLKLPRSLSDAQDALSYSTYYDIGTVIEIGDITDKTQNTNIEELNELMNHLASELGACVKVGDIEQSEKLITIFFNAIAAAPALPGDFLKNSCFKFIFELSKCLSSINHELDEFCEEKGGAFLPILTQREPQLLRTFLLSIVHNVTEFFAQMHQQKNSEIIQQILQLIESSYCTDISVAYISEKVYLTPNYISLLFKKETGRTITEYITDIRIEKAKDLLTTTDLRVMEVAEKVGYSNQYYFSSVFKKKTGLQPKQFQKSQAL